MSKELDILTRIDALRNLVVAHDEAQARGEKIQWKASVEIAGFGEWDKRYGRKKQQMVTKTLEWGIAGESLDGGVPRVDYDIYVNKHGNPGDYSKDARVVTTSAIEYKLNKRILGKVKELLVYNGRMANEVFETLPVELQDLINDLNFEYNRMVHKQRKRVKQ